MESLLKVTVYDIENGEPLVLSVRCPVETPFRVKSLALYGMLLRLVSRKTRTTILRNTSWQRRKRNENP